MRIILITLLLTMTACSSLKKEKISVEQNEKETIVQQPTKASKLLNDIWVLKEMPFEAKSVAGKVFQRLPQLEFNINNNSILGNDGCNQIFGDIAQLDDQQLVLGSVGGTKKLCPETMEYTRKFRKALENTRFYKISNLELYLFNEQREELLRFRKVD